MKPTSSRWKVVRYVVGLGAIAFAAFAVVAGCSRFVIRGDGVIKTEDRLIADFSKVSIVGGYQIQWSRGKPALSVSTDQNLLPHIRTVVRGDILQIDSKENLLPTKNTTIIISSDSLCDILATGGNNFKASQLSGPYLKIQATGASNISVDGAVTKLEAHLTGANKLNAKSLQTETATASMTGASDADVTVSDALRVTITGAGSLTYSGHPKSIEKSITGAGSVRHRP